MGELDIATKVLLREDPGAYARLLLDRAGLEASTLVGVRAEETVYAASERRLDKVLRVELAPPGRCEPIWLHLEIEAVWRSDVPRRVHRYWSVASEALEGAELSSFLILLKRDSRQRDDPRGSFVRATTGGTTLAFGFVVIRAWADLDASELLRQGATGLLPLLPYTFGATERRVDEAMTTLAVTRPLARRAELQGALAIFAGDVFPHEDWIARIPKEVLMKSTTLDRLREMGRAEGRAEGKAEGKAEGQAEGQAKGQAKVLAALIAKRLGPEVGADWVRRLAGADDALFDRLIMLLATARDDDALAAGLDELV